MATSKPPNHIYPLIAEEGNACEGGAGGEGLWDPESEKYKFALDLYKAMFPYVFY